MWFTVKRRGICRDVISGVAFYIVITFARRTSFRTPKISRGSSLTVIDYLLFNKAYNGTDETALCVQLFEMH